MKKEMSEDEIREKREELRVTTEIVKEFNKKNPKDAQALEWQREFLEAEKVHVQKQINDKVARISKSFYDTDYLSIEEDIREGESQDFIPLHVYSMSPITVEPHSYAALYKNPSISLTKKQEEFCAFMRKRVIVIMSHYANSVDLENKKVSSLSFRCNVLPDSPALERWILPSHVPISIPLYIIRHFGCMTPNKKIPIVGLVDRSSEEIQQDSQLLAEGFTLQNTMQILGKDSYVRFVRLSTVQNTFKRIQGLVV
jgi:hypothetical protein